MHALLVSVQRAALQAFARRPQTGDYRFGMVAARTG